MVVAASQGIGWFESLSLRAGNRGLLCGLAFTALSFSGTVWAETTESVAASSISLAATVGLLDAYNAALNEDPGFAAAGYALEAGLEYEKIGRAALLPSLSANYGVQRNQADVEFKNSLATQREDRDYQSINGSLQLRQSLINMEGLARYRQGRAETEASEADYQAARLELMTRVFTQYAEANQAEVNLALAVAKREALAEQRMTNDRLLAGGEGTVTDALETQAQLDLAEAEVLAANDSVSNAREALARTIGRPVNALVPLREDFVPASTPENSLIEWQSLAEASNPELDAQRARVRAATQEARRARAVRMPRLDLIANLSQADSDTVSTFEQNSLTRGVGVQFSMPLLAGGGINAEIRQKEALRKREESLLEAMTNEVLVNLQRQFNATQSGRARIVALGVSLESARLLVSATEKSVRAGVRTNLDVLQARQQWFAVRSELSLARYQYLVAELGLRRVAGTLTETDLEGMARLFQPGAKVEPRQDLSSTSSRGATS
ncbi:MAG: TolC family outer membrane protein [Pseudomonadales bacterium]